MNILYVSNENYVKHLAASLISLLENNEEAEEIRIFVFSTGITEESRSKLWKMIQDYRRSISFIQLGDLRERFDYDLSTGRFDISIMGRLFMGELLPKDVERVIYLDCDTVVCRSLKGLWTYDLRGKCIGAVIEPTIDIQTKINIGIAADGPYFNTGVLLVDLQQYREKKFLQRILAYHETINDYALFSDQDAINGALRWEIRILPPKYNFFTNYVYWNYEVLTKKCPIYSLIPKESFERARKQPVIVHFAGDERPWIRGNHNPFRRLYKKYSRYTYWGDEPMEKGKEIYMLAYHGMNLLTRISPKLRGRISELYMQGQRRKK